MKKYCKDCQYWAGADKKCTYCFEVKEIDNVTGEENNKIIRSFDIAKAIDRNINIYGVVYVLNKNNKCKYFKKREDAV